MQNLGRKLWKQWGRMGFGSILPRNLPFSAQDRWYHIRCLSTTNEFVVMRAKSGQKYGAEGKKQVWSVIFFPQSHILSRAQMSAALMSYHTKAISTSRWKLLCAFASGSACRRESCMLMKELEHKLPVLIYVSSGVMFTFMEVIDIAQCEQDLANPLICALTIHYHSHLNNHTAQTPKPCGWEDVFSRSFREELRVI